MRLRERRAGTRVAGAWERVRQGERLREEIAALGAPDSATVAPLLGQAESLVAEAERLDPAWIAPVVLRGWLAYDQADAAIVRSDSAAASAAAAWLDRGLSHAQRALGLHPDAARLLAFDADLAEFFEAATAAAGDGVDAKAIANWVTGDLVALARQQVGQGGAPAPRPQHRDAGHGCAGGAARRPNRFSVPWSRRLMLAR